MGRQPNPFARPYKLSDEAKAQRKQAALDRWNGLEDEARSLMGRPRKKIPRRHAVRDAVTGKFSKSKVEIVSLLGYH